MMARIWGFGDWDGQKYQNPARHTKKGVDTMAYFQLPNGGFGYYNSKYGSYSPEHGWVYNNQREETELVNSIVDDKLAEYSRRTEAELE